MLFVDGRAWSARRAADTGVNILSWLVGRRCINGKNTRLFRTIIGGRTLCGQRVCAPNRYRASSRRIRRSPGLFTSRATWTVPTQEHQDLISLIGTIRDKFNINLVWFGPGREVIDYLNHGQPRDQVKVTGFEYFGHSNRACFMFDYSNNIDSATKSWLHENDLKQNQSSCLRSWRLRQELGLPHR